MLLLWETDVSINDFMKVTSAAKTNLKRQLLRQDLLDLQIEQQKKYESFARDSDIIQNIYDSVLQSNAEQDALRAQQQAQNSLTSAYNSVLTTYNNARSALNSAISTYNGINPPTASSKANLQTAINTYNTAIGAAIIPYNGQFYTVAQYNNLVQDFNAYGLHVMDANLQRQGFGMPALPFADAPSSPVVLVVL